MGITDQMDSICTPFEVKSPFTGGMIKVAVSPENERIRQFIANRRLPQIFEAYYNLCGIVPPVNNIGHYEQDDPFPDDWGGIRRAHAIFKGLKRPCKEPGLDDTFYTYVTKPRFRYMQVSSMVCPAKRVEAPGDLLFLAVVSFQMDSLSGEILNWDWVEADPKNPNFPIDFETRYAEKVWDNG